MYCQISILGIFEKYLLVSKSSRWLHGGAVDAAARNSSYVVSFGERVCVNRRLNQFNCVCIRLSPESQLKTRLGALTNTDKPNGGLKFVC